MLLFFNDTATTEIYTLSLHDALPISARRAAKSPPSLSASATTTAARAGQRRRSSAAAARPGASGSVRSEEHTSELQSRQYLVCRLLLEKNNIHETLLSSDLIICTSGH